MLCKCRMILMTTGLKLRLKWTTSHTGCEAWRYMREEKRCRSWGKTDKRENVNTTSKQETTTRCNWRVEGLWDFISARDNTLKPWRRVAAWSQREWRNYLQSVTGLHGFCRLGHSFLFSMSILHTRTSTCACFYMATVYERDRRGRINCAMAKK